MAGRLSIKKLVEIHDLIYVLLVLAFMASIEIAKKVYDDTNGNPDDETSQLIFGIILFILFIWSSIGIVALLIARFIELVRGLNVVQNLIRRIFFIAAFIVFAWIIALIKYTSFGYFID